MKNVKNIILGMVIIIGLMSFSASNTEAPIIKMEVDCVSVYNGCDERTNFLCGEVFGCTYYFEYSFFANCMTNNGC